MDNLAPERLAEVFVEVADTLVDDFDLIEFLQMVTSQATDLVSARAAGLLLAGNDGRLRFVAASDERTEMVELFQVQAEEGPCQDCFRQGHAVSDGALGGAGGRWPRFAPMAVAAGFQSVHAFPLRLRSEVIGALNLFGTEAAQLSERQAKVVQALADVATIAVLQERNIRRSEELSTQLQSALDSRVVIEQAKGALSQLLGVTPDEAFTRLRAHCRSHHLRLGEVARRVVDDPASLTELLATGR